jgi:pSer/pThr/pTyr-binding forkhead associated (FHA) protein
MSAIESPATLKVRSDNFHEIEYPIYGNCLIGRHSSNDVTLKDEAVSRVHALIMPVDKSYLICNLESRNRLYVNGKRVQEVVLKDGDEIRIGTTPMIFMQKVQVEESSWPQDLWENILGEILFELEDSS